MKEGVHGVRKVLYEEVMFEFGPRQFKAVGTACVKALRLEQA